ncbi:unnamed protein product [Heterobilharzia americana]|nr:unnamed protein product [Heterobilharzia americana]CAH8466838.1 unnamed protein product [Heterobilharzia americana]
MSLHFFLFKQTVRSHIIMRRRVEFFAIFLYFLVNIINKYNCLRYQCYDCQSCRDINDATPVKNNCLACSTFGTADKVSRSCFSKFSVQFPIYKPFKLSVCYKNLCNSVNYSQIISTPKPNDTRLRDNELGWTIRDAIRCHICSDCTNSIGRIESGCGACGIKRNEYSTDKYCLTSCDEIVEGSVVSCCTTDLCNAMMKLNIHTKTIIFLLVFVRATAYILW